MFFLKVLHPTLHSFTPQSYIGSQRNDTSLTGHLIFLNVIIVALETTFPFYGASKIVKLRFMVELV